MVLFIPLSAQPDEVEFVLPAVDASFDSNLGSQNIVLVDESRKWVGKKPTEIAPGAVPLGILSHETLDVEKFIDEPSPEANDSLPVPTVPKKTEKKRPVNWVGALPDEIADNPIPLGTLKDFSFKYLTPAQVPKVGEDNAGISDEATAAAFSFFSSTRFNRTNNVLRTSENIDGSGVWENVLGGSLSGPSLHKGQYLTLIPKLDMMMQWANYDNPLVKDLLNYRFGMVKAGLNFQFPSDWSISTNLEYDFLHSQTTGDKMFDAVVPSVSVSKLFVFDESTFLMTDFSLRYSFTDKVINFVAEGVFPDDGDNLQTSLTFALVKLFGENGQFRFMPTMGLMLARYSNHEHEGRADFVPNFGLSLGWQPWEWFNVDLGINYSTLSTNSKGEAVLLTSSTYQAYDLSLMFSANKSF